MAALSAVLAITSIGISICTGLGRAPEKIANARGRGHALFERNQSVAIAELKGQQFARRAYVAPDHFPIGMSLPSTAVADLMESVAVFILSGRYIGFLPEHFARHWVAQDLMRALLDRELGYQNPILGDQEDRTEQTDIIGISS